MRATLFSVTPNVLHVNCSALVELIGKHFEGDLVLVKFTVAYSSGGYEKPITCVPVASSIRKLSVNAPAVLRNAKGDVSISTDGGESYSNICKFAWVQPPIITGCTPNLVPLHRVTRLQLGCATTVTCTGHARIRIDTPSGTEAFAQPAQVHGSEGRILVCDTPDTLNLEAIFATATASIASDNAMRLGCPLMASLDGVHFVPTPCRIRWYTADQLSPPSGQMSGSSNVVITGANLCDTKQLAVRFMCGSWRQTVAAVFKKDAVICKSPVYLGEDTVMQFPTGVRSVKLRPQESVPVAEVEVAVSLDGGKNWTLPCAKRFIMYPPPAVLSLTPCMGPVEGGTLVTLHGAGFYNTGEISILFFSTWASADGTAHVWHQSVPAHWISSRTITCVSPQAKSGGLVRVEVVMNKGQQRTRSGQSWCYYHQPCVHSMKPVVGSCAGGNQILITGTNIPNCSSLCVRFADGDEAMGVQTDFTGESSATIVRANFDQHGGVNDPYGSISGRHGSGNTSRRRRVALSIESLWTCYRKDVGLMHLVAFENAKLGIANADEEATMNQNMINTTDMSVSLMAASVPAVGWGTTRVRAESISKRTPVKKLVRLSAEQAMQRVHAWLEARETTITKAFEKNAPKFHALLEEEAEIEVKFTCSTPQWPRSGYVSVEVSANGVNFTRNGRRIHYLPAHSASSVNRTAAPFQGGGNLIIMGRNLCCTKYARVRFSTRFPPGSPPDAVVAFAASTDERPWWVGRRAFEIMVPGECLPNGQVACKIPQCIQAQGGALLVAVDVAVFSEQFSSGGPGFIFYDQPHGLSVEPSFGPSTGGTRIVLRFDAPVPETGTIAVKFGGNYCSVMPAKVLVEDTAVASLAADSSGNCNFVGAFNNSHTQLRGNAIECITPKMELGPVKLEVALDGRTFLLFEEKTVKKVDDKWAAICFQAQKKVELTGAWPMQGARRYTTQLAISGHNFVPSKSIRVRFTYIDEELEQRGESHVKVAEGRGEVSVRSELVRGEYVTSSTLCCVPPSTPPGTRALVAVSFNGQQFHEATPPLEVVLVPAPLIKAVSPTRCSAVGGVIITITGDFLQTKHEFAIHEKEKNFSNECQEGAPEQTRVFVRFGFEVSSLPMGERPCVIVPARCADGKVTVQVPDFRPVLDRIRTFGLPAAERAALCRKAAETRAAMSHGDELDSCEPWLGQVIMTEKDPRGRRRSSSAGHAKRTALYEQPTFQVLLSVCLHAPKKKPDEDGWAGPPAGDAFSVETLPFNVIAMRPGLVSLWPEIGSREGGALLTLRGKGLVPSENMLVRFKLPNTMCYCRKNSTETAGYSFRHPRSDLRHSENKSNGKLGDSHKEGTIIVDATHSSTVDEITCIAPSFTAIPNVADVEVSVSLNGRDWSNALIYHVWCSWGLHPAPPPRAAVRNIRKEYRQHQRQYSTMALKRQDKMKKLRVPCVPNPTKDSCM